MAQFYGWMKGSRKTEATMSGDRASGLVAKINGWKMGVEVNLYDVGGTDMVRVYLTLGSEGTGKILLYRGSEPEVIAKIKDALEEKEVENDPRL